MGEMADYLIDQMMDEEGYWGPVRTRRSRSHPNPICRFCGKTGLRWKDTKTGYRLYEGKNQHDCQPNNNNPEGFENVD